jgi:hypothetical protein
LYFDVRINTSNSFHRYQIYYQLMKKLCSQSDIEKWQKVVRYLADSGPLTQRGAGSGYLRETEMLMSIDRRVVTGDLGWPGSCDVLCGRRLPIGYLHV